MRYLEIIGMTILSLMLLGCEKTQPPTEAVSPQVVNETPDMDQATVVTQEPVALDMVDNMLDVSTFASVDVLNGIVGVENGAVVPVKGSSFTIAGFAVDKVHESPAAGVIIIVDEQTFTASYGGERPDIASALENPNYLKSQFFVTIPTDDLTAGNHKVSLRIVAADQSGYFAYDWSATVAIADK